MKCVPSVLIENLDPTVLLHGITKSLKCPTIVFLKKLRLVSQFLLSLLLRINLSLLQFFLFSWTLEHFFEKFVFTTVPMLNAQSLERDIQRFNLGTKTQIIHRIEQLFLTPIA